MRHYYVLANPRNDRVYRAPTLMEIIEIITTTRSDGGIAIIVDDELRLACLAQVTEDLDTGEATLEYLDPRDHNAMAAAITWCVGASK